MHICEIFEKYPTTFSFEFFPPKSDAGFVRLFNVMKELTPLGPSFVSVTYGAGGSTRKKTHDLVMRLHNETELTVIPHLTCVGATRLEIKDILNGYYKNGIRNVLALKGDPPSGGLSMVSKSDFRYAADLVAYIRKEFPDMGIGVAGFPEGHPLTPNRLYEMDHLKTKIDAGADYICTQLFFDNRDFYDFKERCELAGINVPIIAGIMPVTSKKSMNRMAELSAGSRFPAPLLRSVGRASDDELVKNVGVHWATEQVRDLLERKAKGIHFYTLNHSEETLNIYRALGVTNSSQLF